MSDDYTPTTATVRDVFIDGAEGEFIGEDFDRWYAAEKAKWQAEGWDEGVLLLADRHNISVGLDWLRLSNPHRIEKGDS